MRSSSAVAPTVVLVVLASIAGCTGIGFDGSASPTEGAIDGETETETATATDEPTAEEEATDDGTTDAEECPDERAGTDAGPTNATDGPEMQPPETDAGNASATFLACEGNVTVTLEIANTSAERTEGLMGRESLPENHGMVFVYPDADERSFWMKNTLLPLDMIFVAANGTVLNVEHADPEPDVPDADLERYRSDGPAQYVIELEQGFANRTGVAAGDEVVFHEALYVDGRRVTNRSGAAGIGATPARVTAAGLADSGEWVIPSALEGRIWHSGSSSAPARPAP